MASEAPARRPFRAPLTEGVVRPNSPRTSAASKAKPSPPAPSPAVKTAMDRVKQAKAATPSSPKPSPTVSTPTSTPSRRPAAAASRAAHVGTESPARAAVSSAALRAELSKARQAAREKAKSKEGEDELTWQMPPINGLIEKAKTSGRLNIASRSLSTIPAEVYAELLSRGSIFHPATRNPAPRRQTIDLSISAHDDDEEEEARWYQMTELKVLNASLNELEAVQDEVGGFAALQNIDLHHNRLTALPASFGLLVNLTMVDLKHNQLSTFPLPLLALEALQELDLSDNLLSTLWPSEWRPQLKEVMSTVGKPPRDPNAEEDIVTPDQSLEADFHSLFPSSPTKPNVVSVTAPDGEAVAIRQALPSLQKLRLARNRLPSSVLNDPLFVLSTGLTSLDLTGNPLVQPIDLSGPVGRLPDLRTLTLADCGLGDEVFILSGPHGESLPSLVSLDLTRNGLDTLESLEKVLKVVAPATNLAYTGAPASLRKLVPQATDAVATDGHRCVVTVRDNFLRDEARRRRHLFASVPTSASPTIDAGAALQAAQTNEVDALSRGMEKIGWENQLTEGEKRRRRAEEARVPHSAIESPATEPVVEATRSPETDPANELLRERFSLATATLDLKGRQLAALPAPSTPLGTPSIEPKEVDASNNALTSVPLRTLSEWSWSSCLTRLRLVRNHITAIDWVASGCTFPALEELDLSSNRLASIVTAADGSPTPLLSAIASLAPALSILDLSLNQLTSDGGIGDIVAPGLTADSTNVRAKGVTALRLQNNQIESLDELAAVATSLGQGGSGVFAYQGWRCEELIVSDNNVAKLPPALGLLPPPLQLLAVGGNPFRIPNRRVYEGAGGTKTLLAWLKDRI